MGRKDACHAVPGQAGQPGLRSVRERPTAFMCVSQRVYPLDPNPTKLGALELSRVPNSDPSGKSGHLGGAARTAVGCLAEWARTTQTRHNRAGNAKRPLLHCSHNFCGLRQARWHYVSPHSPTAPLVSKIRGHKPTTLPRRSGDRRGEGHRNPTAAVENLAQFVKADHPQQARVQLPYQRTTPSRSHFRQSTPCETNTAIMADEYVRCNSRVLFPTSVFSMRAALSSWAGSRMASGRRMLDGWTG